MRVTFVGDGEVRGIGRVDVRRSAAGFHLVSTFLHAAVDRPDMTVPPEVEELIDGAPVMAHLATCADGRPHVAPVWYAYHDGGIEILTTGRKLANVRQNPRVAISIQKDEDEEAKLAAARRINPKYGGDERSFPENTLVRIEIGTATYRTY